ncbi:MAG: type I-E CRISPR-associated protein Cas7/Cse4/CasC [Chloroflexota bacterium]|nr:type I-E CRISPR-associated protein Cas7/Cse4/CasC [Chloroflexota bacterium]
MLIELHAIQNFAPSNLNRDDTGAPKDCIFGGYRRARVSSQAFKRAMRMEFRDGGLLPDKADIGTRTKRIVEELTKRLEKEGIAKDGSKPLIERALGGLGLKLDEDKTQYLLFVGPRELDALAAACVQLRDAGESGAVGDGAAKSGRNAKKEAKSAITGTVKAALIAAMDGGKAADIALFGRMVADNADINTDAACQVAHAISTHKTDIEFDYYTAVDDLNPKEETGAGMIGTVEFNSACFYRYANVDLDQLSTNLGKDAAAVRQTVEAFVRAFVTAIPAGKQNSMAAQNPPSFVLAVVRNVGTWSLANAFVRPVPQHADDLVKASIARLDTEWAGIAKMYSTRAIRGTWWCASHDLPDITLRDEVPDVDTLVDRALAAAQA